METSLHIPWKIQLDKVDVRLQDESRFDQQNTTIRVWATNGTRPKVVRQQQFGYVYLFDAIYPATHTQ
ncbi:hypothetical protein Q4530_08150 [Colwellia sp. 1_MG-2023]|uniref:hypothetical protein n=1 Tax=unclassified Colwellia TaxID=196834 RepID=UPI0026E32174|nr:MULTISPECIES: hypothetical protein [unclassified Colwellia]MDO6654077.1 hypothetical protein [Colwellia sp. 3_MG-2023]MDO6665495.1 hypothetical protein [Colwellia sp. 2_MG-2023]MDO6689746.1 hypothetical protein [Colwellia sp. 1_MG-2023]